MDKKCSSCQAMLPAEEFYRNASHADGLTHECKECHHKRYRANRETILAKKKIGYVAHPRIKEPVPDGFKRCQHCGVTKEATTQFFGIGRKFADGLDPQCLLCRRARALARREATKAHHAKWNAENGNAVREWRQRIRQEMLDAYGRKCVCCGDAHEEFLTLDHIGGRTEQNHPWSAKTGTYVYGKLKKLGWPKDLYRLLCMNCNWAIRHGGACPHESDRGY